MSPPGTTGTIPGTARESSHAQLLLIPHLTQRIRQDLFPSQMCCVLSDADLVLGPDGFCSHFRGRDSADAARKTQTPLQGGVVGRHRLA